MFNHIRYIFCIVCKICSSCHFILSFIIFIDSLSAIVANNSYFKLAFITYSTIDLISLRIHSNNLPYGMPRSWPCYTIPAPIITQHYTVIIAQILTLKSIFVPLIFSQVFYYSSFSYNVTVFSNYHEQVRLVCLTLKVDYSFWVKLGIFFPSFFCAHLHLLNCFVRYLNCDRFSFIIASPTNYL